MLFTQSEKCNPSRLDPGRRENINLNFFFKLFCGASKYFISKGTTKKFENKNLS